GATFSSGRGSSGRGSDSAARAGKVTVSSTPPSRALILDFILQPPFTIAVVPLDTPFKLPVLELPLQTNFANLRDSQGGFPCDRQSTQRLHRKTLKSGQIR